MPREARVLPGSAGSEQDLEIFDETGELVDARRARDRQLELALHNLGARDIGAFRGAVPEEVRLAWLAPPCETGTVMTIAHPNRITLAPAAFINCDRRPERRAVVLIFRDPVDLPGLRLELKPTVRLELGPGPGEGLGG